jgi:hypothetical protein
MGLSSVLRDVLGNPHGLASVAVMDDDDRFLAGKPLAIASPMPLLLPVMSATFPSSFKSIA